MTIAAGQATVAFTGETQTRYQLGLSENPFPPLPSVLHAVDEVLEHANRYPEFLPHRLPQLIAERVGVPTEQVTVGSGATGVAMQIMHAVLAPGDEMAFCSPNFDGYPFMAGIAGVPTVAVPLDQHGCQDLSALADAVNERTGLVVVCRPHNPTGTLVDAEELDHFLDRIPDRVVVILDEAYAEFLIDQRDRIDGVQMIANHPNVLVLHTFSKAYGLAGLRIGYAIGALDLVARVRRWQLPFGMHASAIAAVEASYAAEFELRSRVKQITAERIMLRDALLRSGIAVPVSYANFLYLPGSGIAGALQTAGIEAKAFPDGSARIAVGDPAAGRAVLTALNVAWPLSNLA